VDAVLRSIGRCVQQKIFCRVAGLEPVAERFGKTMVEPRQNLGKNMAESLRKLWRRRTGRRVHLIWCPARLAPQ